MSCKNCNEPLKDNCFEIESNDCYGGCENTVTTDCVFHSVRTKSIGSLPNIGVTDGASLQYILKQIDNKLGLFLNADFKSFNLHGLPGEINNIKQFVELTTGEIAKLIDKDSVIKSNITEILEALSIINEDLEDIIEINLSNSTLGIVNTDELKSVLGKIITYVADINLLPSLSESQIEDTNTINLSVSGGVLSADVKISPDSGNIIKETDNGLYAVTPSITSILNTIQSDTVLWSKFVSLVKDANTVFDYDIMSSDKNIPIKYINSLGTEVQETAKANVLLQLNNVRRVITSPTTTLRIINKGLTDV